METDSDTHRSSKRFVTGTFAAEVMETIGAGCWACAAVVTGTFAAEVMETKNH